MENTTNISNSSCECLYTNRIGSPIQQMDTSFMMEAMTKKFYELKEKYEKLNKNN